MTIVSIYIKNNKQRTIIGGWNIRTKIKWMCMYKWTDRRIAPFHFALSQYLRKSPLSTCVGCVNIDRMFSSIWIRTKWTRWFYWDHPIDKTNPFIQSMIICIHVRGCRSKNNIGMWMMIGGRCHYTTILFLQWSFFRCRWWWLRRTKYITNNSFIIKTSFVYILHMRGFRPKKLLSNIDRSG